jgi:hypothetical protein
MTDFFLWAADRQTFLTAMQAITNPETGGPLLELDENHTVLASEGVQFDEIGPIVKTDEVVDPDTGVVTTPAVLITGHHVNARTYGALAANGFTFGPPGWIGTSGVKVLDPSGIDTPSRVWA